jgi:flagellar assembly factor FliW
VPTTIDSTRFGRIEVAPDSEIAFPDGLAGFDSRRFTLIAREQDDAFVWLHSLEDPALALPLADPRRFFGAFALDPAPAADAAIYVTVRAAERPEDFTANLRAPIVIADGVGRQVINEAPGAELRAPLLAELVAAASDDRAA